MTKERLQGLSFASLLDIAEKEGIAVPEGTDKDSLIEQIEEAMEEDRTEREQSNNSAMRIKEKKYDIIRDEEPESEEDEEEYPLPDRYNETRIVAMLRDPMWAFAYWELRESDRKDLVESADFDGLFLRVCELNASRESDDIADYFEIPVKPEDSSWYINLPTPGRSYWIELHGRVAEGDSLLCRSNTVHSPLGEVAVEYLHELMSQSENDALALSGLGDAGSSSFRENIPQRIISMIDSDYLQIKG